MKDKTLAIEHYYKNEYSSEELSEVRLFSRS